MRGVSTDNNTLMSRYLGGSWLCFRLYSTYVSPPHTASLNTFSAYFSVKHLDEETYDMKKTLR